MSNSMPSYSVNCQIFCWQWINQVVIVSFNLYDSIWVSCFGWVQQGWDMVRLPSHWDFDQMILFHSSHCFNMSNLSSYFYILIKEISNKCMFLVKDSRRANNRWKNKMAPVYKTLLKWENSCPQWKVNKTIIEKAYTVER